MGQRRHLRAASPRAFVFGLLLSAAWAQQAGDPTRAEVSLGSRAGWDASLVYAGDAGVWTCGATKAFPQFGAPEVFGLDDKGRLLLCVGYSGVWTPLKAVEDREWLGAFASGDVDPRTAGTEIYVGGKSGRLWQVRPGADLACDARVIARFPGREIHVAVAADWDPAAPGLELIVFLHDGEALRLRPDGPGGAFAAEKVANLPGRVRDALVVPGAAGAPADVVAACRAGQVLRLRLDGGALRATTLVEEPMGVGRVARRQADGPLTLYATRDDGVVVRLVESPEGFRREAIYAGAQGLRGVAAGRFGATPDEETLAVFGYAGEVKLLARTASGAWTVSTVFSDFDRGHWLAAGEIDGRNGSDEILASGYGGRIVALSRPPGFGLVGTLADPGRDARAAPPIPAPSAPTGSEAAPTAPPPPSGPRVAIRAGGPANRISPLRYGGGFETKTLLFETLVVRDDDGALAPGLATTWTPGDGGATWRFKLRPGATFHDGSPADAAAVALHFRRFARLPEHAWLGTSRLFRDVEAPTPDEVVLRLHAPYPVPEELCVVNPCAITAPGAFAADGEFAAPVGSGPYRLERTGPGSALRLEAFGGPAERGPLTLRRFSGDDAADAPLAALLSGEIDLLFDGWSRDVPRDRVEALRADPRFKVTTAPGSTVTYLVFKGKDGPTADPAVRRAVAAAVDRAAIVAEGQRGFARPCRTLFGPDLAAWPTPPAPTSRGTGAPLAPSPATAAPLRLAVDDDPLGAATGQAIAASLRRTGLTVETVGRDTDPTTWDLRLEESWGVPYDPFVSLRNLFRGRGTARTAVRVDPFVSDPRLDALIDAASAVMDDAARRAAYAAVQAHVDAEALVVPLFTPDRVAVASTAIPPVKLPRDVYRFGF